MKLEVASLKAMRYACLNFHYLKSMPVNPFGYSVFNNKNEWCGVVIYSYGANNNIHKPFNLKRGNVLELTRVALNGKQEITSKVLSISLNLIKKDAPLCKLIVSYADIDNGHIGVIYQATNWYYVGTSNKNGSWIILGKKYHGKTISNWIKANGGLGGMSIKDYIKQNYDKNAYPHITMGKIKYLYPLDKSLVPLCQSLKKKYLKNASVV